MLDLTQPAVISEDSRYRYFLSRTLSPVGKRVAFVGLNPSTADEKINDPTIRRCMDFAVRWGGCSLWMVNLFAYRATKPSVLQSVLDPIGEHADAWLDAVVSQADIVVAAWGNHGQYMNRAASVLAKHGHKLTALTLTKRGMPGHPLYIKAETKPVALLPRKVS